MTTVVEGEPGIGKTTLLEDLVAGADGWRVLRAGGVEGVGSIAFAALTDLLRPLAGRLGELPPFQRAVLAGALGLAPPCPAPPFAVGVATLGLLAAEAAHGPVLVAVDDLQWIDEASTSALAFAARRLGTEPVAVVATARPGEAGPFGAAGFDRITLGGLELPAAIRVLGRAAGVDVAPEMAVELVAATGGNPLALEEVARHLEADVLAGTAPLPAALPVGDRLVDALAAGRLAALPADTRAAVSLVALSTCPDTAVLAAALEDLGLALQALDPAEAAGVLRFTDQGVAFTHPLLRTAARGVGAEDQQAAHLALAAACQRAGDRERETWHLAAAAAAPDEATAATLEAIAREWSSFGGAVVAATAMERAARLTPPGVARTRRLVDAAGALLVAGRPSEVAALLDEAAADGDPVLRAEAERVRGQLAVVTGSPETAVRLLLAAATDVAARAPLLAAALFLEAGLAALMDGRVAAALAAGRQAHELAVSSGSGPRRQAATLCAYALVALGRHTEARAFVAEVDDLPRLASEEEAISTSDTALLLLLERYDDLLAHVDEEVVWARRRSAVAALPQALAVQADALCFVGRWPEALAAATEAVELAGDIGHPVLQRLGAVMRARVEAGRGRVRACRANLDLMSRAGPAAGRGLDPMADDVRCLLLLGRGRVSAAAAAGEQAARAWRDVGVREPSLARSGGDRVEALVHADRPEEARTALEPWRTAAAEAGRRWAVGVSHRCEALLASGDAAEEHLHAALDVLTATTAPFELARTELACGQWLRRRGRRQDARAHLARALDLLDELGAAPWAERARAELRSTGAAAPEPRRRAADVLTAPELRVALSVARGATNKEAAAALFLSPKTIEFHLSAAYRKLGVRSRSELVRRVVEEGLLRSSEP